MQAVTHCQISNRLVDVSPLRGRVDWAEARGGTDLLSREGLESRVPVRSTLLDTA